MKPEVKLEVKEDASSEGMPINPKSQTGKGYGATRALGTSLSFPNIIYKSTNENKNLENLKISGLFFKGMAKLTFRNSLT